MTLLALMRSQASRPLGGFLSFADSVSLAKWAVGNLCIIADSP
jgi:hypothetical protein